MCGEDAEHAVAYLTYLEIATAPCAPLNGPAGPPAPAWRPGGAGR
jgi:hypothetical protein